MVHYLSCCAPWESILESDSCKLAAATNVLNLVPFQRKHSQPSLSHGGTNVPVWQDQPESVNLKLVIKENFKRGRNSTKGKETASSLGIAGSSSSLLLQTTAHRYVPIVRSGTTGRSWLWLDVRSH
jgi:hypothetical protein